MRLLVAVLLFGWALFASAAPSVALFYGKDAPLAELKAFDIVIVEPDHGYDPRRYRHPESELFAYVAVGEANPSRPWFRDIPAGAKLAENPAWGSAVIDLSQPDWPNFVAERMVTPLWEKGYRGFFLDTLDSYRLAKNFDEAAQQKGLVTVIETLHRRFPGIRLILNRGFEVVPALRGKIMMVAAESLFQGWDAASRRYVEVPAADREWLLGQLRKVRDEYGIPVLAIDYVAPTDRKLTRATAERIKALGIVPWVTDGALETLGIGAVEVMPRKLLFLFDGREAPAINYTNIHRFVEMPANHLGYVAEYHDVNAPLPEQVFAGRAAGVVLWLPGPPQKPKALADWLRRRMEEGVRIAFIGQFGIPLDATTMRRMGLAMQTGPAAGAVTLGKHDPMFGFEAPLAPERQSLLPLRLTGAGRPLVEVSDAKGGRYVAAAFMPWGGFALNPFVLREIPGTEQARWLVDPFAFLAGALGQPAMPVPDVTTENGRRLLLAHIDGDGFPSRGEFPGSPLAGRVLLDEVLKRYPIPHGVSVIEAEIAPHGLHPKDAAEMEAVARQIFALPNVEIASHTFSHPFRWDSNVKHGIFSGAESEEAYHLAIPGYKMDLHREIVGSVDYVRNRLAPAGKPVRLLFWSGDTAPGEDALRIADEAHLLNFNGGDTFITKSAPSLTGVQPLGIRKGVYRQIYAPVTNENLYTNLWRGPFYGYRRAIETFEMTEAPRRLKPIGIYYHSYSASKRASLEALRQVYDWALARPVHPVYPSEYIRKVLDFYDVVIARAGDEWLVRTAGDLRTLRAPATLGNPDPGASAGLAGFIRGAEGNYLHLAGTSARIAFAPQAPPRPYLRQANARLSGWQNDRDGLRFELRGHQALEFALANAGRCTVSADGKPLKPFRQTEGAAFFRVDHAAAAIQARCPHG
ncbi:MAG: bifunctional glycoside hydrolase 114/ polysaccharide deacetylase family protein [Betaproteobacteria bacterium]